MRKTRKEYRERTRKTLEKLLTIELRIKLFKSEFEKKEVKFLKYIVGQKDIKSDPKKIRVLKEWSRFTKIKKVQSLMDFINYYRKLSSKLLETTYLLNQLLKKKRKWEWKQKKKKSFQQIIRNISEESRICFYDLKILLIIKTDASDYTTRTTLL